ncbi:interleukin-13 receptor subunit alpha-1-like [Rhinophrynus dorsalis]
MGTGRCCWISVSLTLICANWISGIRATTATEDKLPSPTNITFLMDSVFNLTWNWKMPEGVYLCPNDTLKFYSVITNIPPPHQRTLRSNNLYRLVKYNELDLNHRIDFKVRAVCPNSKRSSEWAYSSILVAQGNPNTSIRNFDCFWYKEEYVNCTWQHGLDAPPNTTYSLLYWLVSVKLFEHLLESGEPCQHYIYKNGVPVGCHLKYQNQHPCEFIIVVTNKSATIKPFIKYLDLHNFIKTPAPNIVHISRTNNQSLHVSWEISYKDRPLDFEVQVNKLNGDNIFNPKDIKEHFIEVPNVHPDTGYTVRVRAKTNSGVWSEWSKEETLPANQAGGTIFVIVVLVIISLIIIVSTVILLIYQKRLKAYILPPIPDPRRVFKNRFGDPNDVQQWMKYRSVNTFSPPPKEEVCSVILEENSHIK